MTFAFQTSRGERGVLQITGFAEDPRGVKIRYKPIAQPADDVAVLRPKLRSGEIDVRREAMTAIYSMPSPSTNLPALHSLLGNQELKPDVERAIEAIGPFGPGHDVTLTEFNNRDGQEALDLDPGAVFKQPKDMDQWSEEGLVQWVKENGVDLFVDHGPGGVWSLLTTTNAELKLARVGNDKWGVISEAELVRVLAGDSTPLQIVTQGMMKVYLLPKEMQLPMTFAFKTSSGGVGVLQVTGYKDHLRGVKIRYKQVQTKPAASIGSGKLEGSHRQFVRLVVDKAAMTFEGQPTTWDDVGALLEKVLERKNTVLECAIITDQITDIARRTHGGVSLLRNGLRAEHGIRRIST